MAPRVDSYGPSPLSVSRRPPLVRRRYGISDQNSSQSDGNRTFAESLGINADLYGTSAGKDVPIGRINESVEETPAGRSNFGHGQFAAQGLSKPNRVKVPARGLSQYEIQIDRIESTVYLEIVLGSEVLHPREVHCIVDMTEGIQVSEDDLDRLAVRPRVAAGRYGVQSGHARVGAIREDI